MAVIGEIIRASIRYATPNGDPSHNVFHWIVFTGSPTDSEIVAELGNWFVTEWTAVLDDIISADVSFEEVVFDVVSNLGDVIRHLGEFNLTGTGTQANDALPAGVAALITVGIDIAKGVAKKYIPGVSEALDADNRWVSAALNVLALALANWLQAVVGGTSGATYVPGVLSSQVNGFVGLQDLGRVVDEPAYQRRRRQGS